MANQGSDYDEDEDEDDEDEDEDDEEEEEDDDPKGCRVVLVEKYWLHTRQSTKLYGFLQIMQRGRHRRETGGNR